jgi:hypothetical protein
MAERMEAALHSERPALISENFNMAVCPILVLPRMFFKTEIVPLFEGSRVLRPLEEYNRIEGWATDRNGNPNQRPFFSQTPFGFTQFPSSGRPIREGATTEILPYS